MKKKILIIIGAIVAVAAVVGIAFTVGKMNSDSSSTKKKVKTIDVGDYTLKLGRYEAITAKKEEPCLVLTKNTFYFEDEDEEKFEFEIGENELLFKGSSFFKVIDNDTIEVVHSGGVTYKYIGDKKSSKSSDDDDDKDDDKTETKKTTKPEKGIKTKNIEELTLVNYNGGEFTMKIPQGWKVSKGGTGMFYGIRVYDPKDDRNQIFYILKEQPFYKSENAESMYKMSVGYASGIYIGGPATTEQIFKVNNQFANKAAEIQAQGYSEYKGFVFPYITNFTVVESMEGNSILHNQAVDDKVLRATFNNGSTMNDGEAEGLFNACVVDFGTLGYGNDQFSYYMAYNVSGITTAKDNLINYEEVLLESLNSIQFSAAYAKTTSDATNQQTNNAINASKQLSQAYQSYNDAWSNRQKSYDIQSQKRSDATLGYERVVDTETGEIYKAYNGFTDDYQGKRYQPISDSQYTEKVTGYIEK